MSFNNLLLNLKKIEFRNQLYLGVGQAFCHLSLFYVLFHFSINLFLLSLLFYFLMTSFGVSITIHRYLSHGSVTMPSAMRWLGLYFFSLSVQGSPLSWIAMHREHHRYSDRPGDPHNPEPHFWKTYFLSMFYVPRLRYVTELVRLPDQQFFHRYYWAINLSYSLILYFLGGFDYIIYLHLFPAFLCWQGISVAKTVAHKWGYRNYETKDTSCNVPFFGYLTFGEAWHNNHHALPANYTFQKKWYEIDISALFIQLCFLLKIMHPNKGALKERKS